MQFCSAQDIETIPLFLPVKHVDKVVCNFGVVQKAGMEWNGTEWNQLGHAPDIKFVLQPLVPMIHSKLMLDFVFPPTNLLETLFALISIKCSLQNFYLIPTLHMC